MCFNESGPEFFSIRITFGPAAITSYMVRQFIRTKILYSLAGKSKSVIDFFLKESRLSNSESEVVP